MKALILCAGEGKRLRPITNDIPKPMVEVGGYPVLAHLIFHVFKYGVSQIIVNVHYKYEIIMNYFGNALLYSYEPILLGEEATIKGLSNWLSNDYTIVMNGDTLTDINLNKMFTRSEGKNIRSMDYKTKVYTGCKILSPDYFKGNQKFIDYYDSEMYWIDMGTPKGLDQARKKYEESYSLRKLSD
jgi:NDP-sugar pyrophosphorylase family protein